MNMGMLDEAEASRSVTRDDFLHLSDVEWATVERMCSTVGAPAVSAMLLGLGPDEQHAAVAKYMAAELERAQADIAALHQHRNAAAGGSTYTRRPGTLKLEVSKFRGVEGDSLLTWFVEVDDAIEALRIEEESMKIKFGMSHLGGRARAWALGLKLHDSNVFESLDDFKSRLRDSFEPPRAEFRVRSELLDLKQGKRDLHAYAQHMRYLVSCIVSAPISEVMKIHIFLKGLTDGPVRTYLFRLELRTLEEAISIAEQEDFSAREARAVPNSHRLQRRQERGGPEPMDLCYVESERPRSTSYKRSQKCHRCQKLGHYSYECSAPRAVPRGTERSERPLAKKANGRGSNAAAKQQQRSGPSKNGRDQ